jgi:metal-responsive CopG/Arc/MetJ family transcriptional regulator
MKSKTILLRLNEKELETIMLAYKNRLINGDYISRSEYIRKLILTSLDTTNNVSSNDKNQA